MGMDNRRKRTLIAVGLVAVGAVLGLGVGSLWPLVIIIPGLIFLGAAARGGRSTAAFAIPGMVIAGTGALLFVQNLTGYWSSWSYAWTLYGVFLGMGLAMMGRLMGDPAFESLGRVFIMVGGVAFGVFGIFMELLIGVSGLGGGLWPLLLIGLGLFLLARPFTLRRALTPKRKNDEQLFTGPVVYGSRKRDASRLSATDTDEQRTSRR